jgi:hypothetical protein
MNIKRATMASVIVLSVLGLVGCGPKVEVPAAYVAKIMTKDGYKEGTIGTSKFRLDPCFAYCDREVLLNVGDRSITETMELFMPKDKLNMTFDLRATLSINPTKYEELFARLPPDISEDNVYYISWQKGYETYARDIIRAEAREFLSQYSIAEVASSREVINAKLSEKLSHSILKRTPFTVRYIGLADIQYPEIIVNAQKNAAERREMIEQENAQLEISKVQLERQLQEQKLQRAIDVEKAEAESLVNKILAESITPGYIKYKELEVMAKIAESQNKVFVPTQMLDSLAGQVQLGIQ